MHELKVGQAVHVGLDAYPDCPSAGGRADLAIGAQSTLSPKVRKFIVLVSVRGAHPNLMPDLLGVSGRRAVAIARRAGRTARRRVPRRQTGLRPGAARRRLRAAGRDARDRELPRSRRRRGLAKGRRRPQRGPRDNPVTRSAGSAGAASSFWSRRGRDGIGGFAMARAPARHPT